MRREEGHEADERRKRKVIVFSYYTDTIDWIKEYLQEQIDCDNRLAVFRGRIASVCGTDSPDAIEQAVYGFAPESAGAGKHEDRFDLLLSTDVLAEGMNLQQSRNIINYDLPWNPMRRCSATAASTVSVADIRRSSFHFLSRRQAGRSSQAQGARAREDSPSGAIGRAGAPSDRG